MDQPARSPVKIALLAILAVIVAVAAVMAYYRLLDVQLAGYRGRKRHDLEMIRRRDARRLTIPGNAAQRERILREEFGELPDGADLRTELELVNTWQKLLMILVAPFALGSAVYAFLGRRRKTWLRALRGFAVFAGVAYALPLMLFPENALAIIRPVGVPVLIVAALILVAETFKQRFFPARG